MIVLVLNATRHFAMPLNAIKVTAIRRKFVLCCLFHFNFGVFLHHIILNNSQLCFKFQIPYFSSDNIICNRGTNNPSCEGGSCLQKYTKSPSCDGGVCDQQKSIEPTCADGGCTQDESWGPTCAGGACTQMKSMRPTCDGGACTQSDSIDPSCNGGGCLQSFSVEESR